MRREYHIDMLVSGQQVETTISERGPKARTRRLMLQAATQLMQSGITPSVTEVAEAAEVSRATAYRYFPSQAALVQAVVDEALGPILSWQSGDPDPRKRVKDLLATAMPRIDEFEATFKAALKLSLDQWAQRQAGTLGNEPRFTRGHRVDLLRDVTAPLEGKISASKRDRLAQALSLVFGVEVLVVLKDIWGLSAAEAQGVAVWAAQALVDATTSEAAAKIVQSG
jgi:AcrR family transcriptional regulator